MSGQNRRGFFFFLFLSTCTNQTGQKWGDLALTGVCVTGQFQSWNYSRMPAKVTYYCAHWCQMKQKLLHWCIFCATRFKLAPTGSEIDSIWLTNITCSTLCCNGRTMAVMIIHCRWKSKHSDRATHYYLAANVWLTDWIKAGKGTTVSWHKQ